MNGRSYRWPDRPLVVVCVDGCEPDYITQAMQAGVAPYLGEMVRQGHRRCSADCVVPSFTNPNNLSIVTGVPPAVHGICGNYFYDREADEEVMMNDPKYLRADTILAALLARRRLGGGGHRQGQAARACSATACRASASRPRRPTETTEAEHGIDGVLELVGLPLPSVYSADLSRVRVRRRREADGVATGPT